MCVKDINFTSFWQCYYYDDKEPHIEERILMTGTSEKWDGFVMMMTRRSIILKRWLKNSVDNGHAIEEIFNSVGQKPQIDEMIKWKIKHTISTRQFKSIIQKS